MTDSLAAVVLGLAVVKKNRDTKLAEAARKLAEAEYANTRAKEALEKATRELQEVLDERIGRDIWYGK